MKRRREWSGLFGALLWVAVIGGCGHHFSLTAPASFVVLDEENESYAMRATNAHGVVMSVREIENEPQGNMDFWLEAVQNRVRLLGGYALIGEHEVKAKSGQKGRQLRFGRDEHGASFFYWVTLFVTDAHIFVVEAGGRRDRFEAMQKDLEKSLSGFEIR